MARARKGISSISKEDKQVKAQATIEPQISSESGSGFTGKESNSFGTTDKAVRYDAIEEMLRRNAVVKAVLSVITLPILSAGWTIDPYDKTAAGAQEQADKVQDILSRPSFAYGLTTPFELFREQSLKAVAHGFAVHEIIWEKDNEGFFYFRKLAHRPQNTVKILADGRGGFNGIEQKALIDGKDAEITIPPEKLFMFTYNKAVDNLYGESQLATAWRYFQMQNDYIKLSAVQGQYKAVMPIFIQARAGMKANSEKLKEMVNVVNEVEHKGVVGVPPEFEVILTQSGGSNWIDYMPWVKYMDNSIAISALAYFLLLGSGSTGSFALSKNQTDFFLQVLNKTKRNFDSHVTDFLLSKLYTANWGETAAYGVFKTDDFDDETIDLIKETILELFRQGRGSDEGIEAIMEKYHRKLGIIELDRYSKAEEVVEDDPVNTGEDTEESPEEPAVA